MYRKVIQPSKSFRIKEVETVRKNLLKNNDLIETRDFKDGKTFLRSISSLAKTSTSKKRFSSFLNLLVKYLKAKSVLETGTAFGINALYLSNAVDSLVTIEGSGILASLAKKCFEVENNENIRLVNADMYQVLESEIVRNKPDFYFLDADHRSTAIAFCIDLILKYSLNVKCIVIHDIYWSRDMLEIWNQLKEDPRFDLSLDIFQAGILFPHLSMEKQHFTLRF